jgi:DNA mismatch repair protein MutL
MLDYKIIQLDKDISNKIAAGEVVERPLAVVKELVENAIDANASKITVEIKEAGKTLIRVTDNGYGIQPEDIVLAFERHSTSKIRTINDIYNISSLGFRGEALASISSVSNMEVITKHTNYELGKKLVLTGGKVLEQDLNFLKVTMQSKMQLMIL